MLGCIVLWCLERQNATVFTYACIGYWDAVSTLLCIYFCDVVKNICAPGKCLLITLHPEGCAEGQILRAASLMPAEKLIALEHCTFEIFCNERYVYYLIFIIKFPQLNWKGEGGYAISSSKIKFYYCPFNLR